MLVDTHCHLTYDDFTGDLPGVIQRARAAGVTRCITVGTTPTDARAGLALCEKYPQLFVAAGIHPHEAAKVTAADIDALHALHHDVGHAGRLVAVGETGLDFHYDFAPPDVQERVFRDQLELALAVGRPVIIHARKSEGRVAEILRDYPALAERVVFHCFSGDGAMAAAILDQGHWLSYTGVVTFKNGDAVREAVRATPLDRLMVETDAPFLSPEPVRKQRPCEPALVAHTARFIAGLKGLTEAELAATTTRNAERFFALGPEAA